MTKKINVNGLKRAIKNDCVVKYYAPWCGHCKALEPTYAEVSQAVSDSNMQVQVLKFNMDKHGKDVQEQNIGMSDFGVPVHQDVKGFPTVILYKKDGSRSMYKGPREVGPMMSTIKAYYSSSS